MSEKRPENSRRDFLKKAAYIPPAIVTLSVAPSVFAYGSGNKCEKPRPEGNPTYKQDSSFFRRGR